MKRELKVAEALWNVKEGIDNVIWALKLSNPYYPKTIVWYQDGNVAEYDIVGTLESSSILNIGNAVKVRIGNKVSSIGNNSFYDCSNLSSIIIPNSVTEIGTYGFGYCSSLKTITIPSNVTTIKLGLFEGCFSLTSITIPDSITSIGENSFHSCSNLSSVVIPNNVKTIGNSAFAECGNISMLKIGSGVTSIGNEAFCNCTSLQYSASYLTSYEIPENVKSVGTSAFYGCSSMTDLNIEPHLYDLNIKSDAFYTSGISGVTFRNSEPTISEVQEKDNYPWGLSGGTCIYCYDGTLVVPSGGSGGSS